MFSNKLAIVLCVIGVAIAADDYFKVLDLIYQENPCTMQGGLCTIAVDCPRGHLLEEKNLCPAQQRLGVECCYGQSIKETRCRKRGGGCIRGHRPCDRRLIIKEATDCAKDTTCCILVQKKSL